MSTTSMSGNPSPLYNWQKGAGRWLDDQIGYSYYDTVDPTYRTNKHWASSSHAGAMIGDRYLKGSYGGVFSGSPDQMNLHGRVDAAAHYTKWVDRGLSSYGAETWQGRGRRAAGTVGRHVESSGLYVANKLNDHFKSQGRGLPGVRFETLGQVLAKAPLKQMGHSYLIGTAMSIGMDTVLFGKSMSLGNLAETAWHSIPFTMSWELAGTGMKGMAKATGWGMLGSAMNLGPWGSLALQVAGTLVAPGLAIPLAVGVGAYHLGKQMYNVGKSLYSSGKGYWGTNFVTGDLSYAASESATMRQRAITAIQNSHMNMRSVLGNEAMMLMS
jgi:hypothetical protein